MAFHVGQKVVCVDAALAPRGPIKCGVDELHLDLSGLKEGETYTISWAGDYEDAVWHLQPSVRVYEIRRVADMPFAAARFRPLVERKTSIEIFQRMLSPKKVRERA